MNSKIFWIAGISCLLPGLASADHEKRFPNPYAKHKHSEHKNESQISYDYLDVRAVTEDFDDGGPDSEGFSLRGSLSLSDSVYLFGKYDWRELDIVGRNIEDNEGNFGLGVNFPLSYNLDLVVQGSYEWIDVNTPGFNDFDDNGFGALAGLRSAISPELELNGHVRYRNLDELDEETFVGAGAVYSFSNGASIGGEWEHGDQDTTRWGVFMRFSF